MTQRRLHWGRHKKHEKGDDSQGGQGKTAQQRREAMVECEMNRAGTDKRQNRYIDSEKVAGME